MIGKKFLYGYHHSLYDTNLADLVDQLNVVDLQYRGFTFEGAAMGMALLDTISLTNKLRLKKFMDGAGKPHIYMLHVGAGWAYAKLPVRVEKMLDQFDPVLKWLVMDGYGFCNAYFKTKKYVKNAEAPALEGYALHAFYQGVGRCLWFVEGANPEKISKRIGSFPTEFSGDLWSGVGLASTYAGGVDKAVIEKLRETGKDYHLYLAQGAAFAAKARILAGNLMPHTDMACQIFSYISANKAASIADETWHELKSVEIDGLTVYESWRKKIRNRLAEILDQPVIT